MTAVRRLAVCADDFGQGAAVDRGILTLAEQRRLTAVSCLVTPRRWQTAAPALRGLPVAAGLHLNLTDGEPLSPALRCQWPQFPRLGALIAMAFLGQLPAALADEVQAQLDRFAEVRGAPPDFLDGHQHVHALPGVRALVLAAARQWQRPVRQTGRILGPGFALKRHVIAACGGRALARQARLQGVAQTTALVGVYDFGPAANYRALVRGWLQTVPDGALLFCHPALAGVDPGDPIAAARQREAAYLASDAFMRDLAAAGVVLG